MAVAAGMQSICMDAGWMQDGVAAGIGLAAGMQDGCRDGVDAGMQGGCRHRAGCRDAGWLQGCRVVAGMG